MNPAAKGTRSFGAYICNTDYESLKKERGQVLDCNGNFLFVNHKGKPKVAIDYVNSATFLLLCT